MDVCDAMSKYSDIVKQLEALLDLEKETLVIKKKVATFSLDYDDDLVITKQQNCKSNAFNLVKSTNFGSYSSLKPHFSYHQT